MELELGLGLSNFSPKMPALKELDLISYVNGEAKQVYDDDDSSLSSQSSVNYEDEGEENDGGFSMKKKRGFTVAFEVESSVSDVPKTLPLLLWDKEPNEHGNGPNRLCQSSSFSISKNDGDGIVGWPPLKSYRRKVRQQNDAHHLGRQPGGNFPAGENGGGGSAGFGGCRSMFVKVQMEGFGITRKIDFRLYHSYESLMYSLVTMFGKGEDSVDVYNLIYQDREGDWLLAGDLPWRTFIQSVQRLKLVRKDD